MFRDSHCADDNSVDMQVHTVLKLRCLVYSLNVCNAYASVPAVNNYVRLVLARVYGTANFLML